VRWGEGCMCGVKLLAPMHDDDDHDDDDEDTPQKDHVDLALDSMTENDGFRFDKNACIPSCPCADARR